MVSLLVILLPKAIDDEDLDALRDIFSDPPRLAPVQQHSLQVRVKYFYFHSPGQFY